MITQKQRVEWTENPVTLELLEFVRGELRETREVKGLGAYHPFQPERTQETLAGLNGNEEVWEIIEARLGADFYEDEEDE